MLKFIGAVEYFDHMQFCDIFSVDVKNKMFFSEHRKSMLSNSLIQLTSDLKGDLATWAETFSREAMLGKARPGGCVPCLSKFYRGRYICQLFC